MKNEFYYAAGYYPLMQKREDWDRDLQTMHDCGIHVVRTAELFNSWDRIEITEGHFDFDFLDEFFDLCQKYEIKIILGTGTATPPYWLHEKYPDVNIINNHGEHYPNNVSYTWACIDHPQYRKYAERYIRTLVMRYKEHPSLFAYQIHNEISFPFMPLQEGSVDIYCYCEHSKKNFRKWLQHKYQTIENINDAYRWGATNTVYSSFDEIDPPAVKCTGWASVTRWLDWRSFWMDNMVSFVADQDHLIKTMDTVHPTTTNIFFLKSQDPLGVITALDQFKMAAAVDVIGYDLYPGSGNKLEKHSEFSCMFLDMARSTVPSGRDYWLLETESGPINGWTLGPSRTVNGNDLFRNVFEAIGHESRMTLYQVFRECDFQPLHWGGLVDLDGEHTDLTHAAMEIGVIVNREKEFFGRAKCPKAKVAILIERENAIVLNGIGQEEFLLKAMRGAYRTFWQKNIAVDFITPQMLAEGRGKEYALIYLPLLTVIGSELSRDLAAYTADGGCLIAGARCGFMNERGWYNHQIPCMELGDVFGVKVSNVFAGSDPKVSIGKKTYQGCWHKEVLDLKSDTEVIGYYADDQPAVTRNRYGKGTAYYIGTHADAAFMESGSLLLWDLLDVVSRDVDLVPYVDVEYANRMDKEINVNCLQTEQRTVLVITNYVNAANRGFFVNGCKKIRLKIKDEFGSAKDLLTSNVIPVTYDDGKESTLSVNIYENKVTLIELFKEQKDV